jgi:hypothetical protein
MKIIVVLAKPRNPLVVPARLRRAGKHLDRRRSTDRQDARALRREQRL